MSEAKYSEVQLRAMARLRRFLTKNTIPETELGRQFVSNRSVPIQQVISAMAEAEDELLSLLPTSSEKVIAFPGLSKLDQNVDLILREAIGELNEVVVTGYDKEGELYFASSKSDGAAVVWLLERAEHKLMITTDELEASDDI